MQMKPRSELWLGSLAVLFALILMFVWIPLDTETGLVEKIRRQVLLGDALGPTLAGVVIFAGGVLTILRPKAQSPRLTLSHLQWLLVSMAVIASGLIIMRYAGPAIASLLSDTPYRALRDTPPWSYLGYVTGGSVIVGGLITCVLQRVTWAAFAIGFAASLALALLYDLPFDDILLPPNGDV